MAKQKPQPNTNNAPKPAPKKARREGWVPLVTSSQYLFSPSVAMAASIERDDDGKPLARELVGYVIDRVHVKPNGKRHWWGLVVLTTEPTVAVNRQKEPVEVPAGERIMIPENHTIKPLARLIPSGEPGERVYQMCLRPAEKIGIAGGHTMWLWDVDVDPRWKPADTMKFKEAALNPALQLPEGSSGGNGGTSEARGDAHEPEGPEGDVDPDDVDFDDEEEAAGSDA